MVNDYNDTSQRPFVVEFSQRPVTDVVEQPDVVERRGVEQELLRRPRRTTARQHRNPHHLPRSTTTQVNQILASWQGFHRPWL